MTLCFHCDGLGCEECTSPPARDFEAAFRELAEGVLDGVEKLGQAAAQAEREHNYGRASALRQAARLFRRLHAGEKVVGLYQDERTREIN